jgi:hypothetical protein
VRLFVASITILSLATLAAPSPIAWVLNTNTTIDVVNVATNADLPYGTAPFQSDSLARSAAGLLYSVDSAGNLWDVTGPPIPVGPTGRTQIGDLDWAAPGGLWGYSNASSELFFFDSGSTSVTYAATIAGLGGATVTGVAHQASNGDMYLSANLGLNTDQLFRVPFSSTSANLIGSMVIGDSFSFISDIDFDAGGTLHAMTWFHRYFYTVSTSTGATTFVSAGPHKDTTGMALNPVPEPGTVAVLLAGILCLRRRRLLSRLP